MLLPQTALIGAAAAAMDPRPSYHLAYDSRSSGNFRLPPLFVNGSRSFMNDPNGLLKFGGRYHVFAQWGMDGHSGASWLHAVSSDLATWQMLPPAIVAGQGNESLSGEWDAGGVYSGHAMVLGGRPVLVYCALDGKLGKARRTVAWAEAEDPSDPQLLRFRKLANQPWVNQSLDKPAFVDTYCDPLTWRSEGWTGVQMVGAIVRSGPSSQITGWRVDSTASPELQPAGPLFDLGFECLCPDFSFLGLDAEQQPLWAAKCLTKCSDPAGHEIGCDVYSIGTKSNASELFRPAQVLPKGKGAANRFPLLDHGRMASSAQTMQDSDNHRVLLWQWLPEGDCEMGQRNCSATATHGQLRDWEGVQTLPRLLRASDECHVNPALAACTLLVQPAPEIERLHTWQRNASTSPASVAVAEAQGPDALHIVARFSQLGGRDAVVAFDGSTRFNISLTGGKAPAGINASSRMMNGMNFGGNNLDGGIHVWPAATSNASQCQDACDKQATPACLMWTFVQHARENHSESMCCLKGGAVEPPTREAGCVSGVKDPITYRLPPALSVGPGWRHNIRSVPMQLKETVSCELPMSSSSSSVELSIFMDHSVVEVFTGTGHCAFAIRVYQDAQPQPPPPRTIRAMTMMGGGGDSSENQGVRSLEVFGMAAAFRDYTPPTSR